MSKSKLPRGVLEIPKGSNTISNDHDFNQLSDKIKYLVNKLTVEKCKEQTRLLRHELEELYINIILKHLSESIKQNVEQELWNNLFKKTISDLQRKLRGADKTETASIQVEFSRILENANGFYSKFLDILCELYKIILPNKRLRDYSDFSDFETRKNYLANEADIRYLLQYCYVHIGDFYRYQGLNKQAQCYYEWAVQIEPSFGHAYNQLAILESSMTNSSTVGNYQSTINTILLYDYACTCQNPFPATRINLESILRRITDESVSELLTSGNKMVLMNQNHHDSAGNCMTSICKAWLHIYAETRLRNNLQRCRQLQQRLIDWLYELVVCNFDINSDNNISNWTIIIKIMGLQCGLISNYLDQQDSKESKAWNSNLQQFTQDMMNSICRGISSIFHNQERLNETFDNISSASCFIIFLCWLNQYMNIKDSNSRTSVPIKVPFGEDIIKLLNSLLNESNVMSMVKEEKHTKLPIDLPECQLLKGYQPMNIVCDQLQIFSQSNVPNTANKKSKESMDIKPSDNRITFILSFCKQVASKWKTLLAYNDYEKKFYYVPVEVVTKKIVKTDQTSSVSKKPVNIALASFKNNIQEPNELKIKSTSSNPVVTTASIIDAVPVSHATDVKIARCIMEHIASDTNANIRDNIAISGNNSATCDNSSSVNNMHILAPAPGLILSSNLPASYKSLPQHSSVYNEIETQSLPTTMSGSISNDLKSNLANFDAQKNNHTYNPNREQFEKDLPPRFANKRSSSQKENKTVAYPSIGYWDSVDDKQHTVSKLEPNLTMKESEMMIPPIVPTAWLNEESQVNETPSVLPNFNNMPFTFHNTPNNISADISSKSVFNNTHYGAGPNISKSDANSTQTRLMYPFQNSNVNSSKFVPSNVNAYDNYLHNPLPPAFSTTSTSNNSPFIHNYPQQHSTTINAHRFNQQQQHQQSFAPQFNNIDQNTSLLRQNNPLLNLLPGFSTNNNHR